MNQKKDFIKEQAKIFKALGHPSRLLMVDALREEDLCVCDLQAVVGHDMSTISRHLGTLREAGVVSSRKEGTSIFYRLELCCLGSFLSCTRDHLATRIAADVKMLG